MSSVHVHMPIQWNTITSCVHRMHLQLYISIGHAITIRFHNAGEMLQIKNRDRFIIRWSMILRPIRDPKTGQIRRKLYSSRRFIQRFPGFINVEPTFTPFTWESMCCLQMHELSWATYFFLFRSGCATNAGWEKRKFQWNYFIVEF